MPRSRAVSAASASKTVRQSAVVPLPDASDAMSNELRLAVVADTHSEPHPNAASLLAALRPHAILHAGDIGDLRVLSELSEIAPVHAVRGNIDIHAATLPDDLTIDIGGADEEDRLLRIFLTHIAVVGPRLRADAARRAGAEGASLVICGHSHVPFIGRDRGLVVFNPGSIGPRRFHLPIVFGVISLIGGRATMKHIDCETGNDWLP